MKKWVSALAKGNGVNLAFWGTSALVGLACYGGNYLRSLEVFEMCVCLTEFMSTCAGRRS